MDPLNADQAKIAADAARTAADYWTVIYRVVPLVLVGGFVSFVINLLKITHEPTWRGRLLLLASVISVGCVAAGVSALGLQLFMSNPTVEIELLAASIAGSSGQKVFDIYSKKLFGLTPRDSLGHVIEEEEKEKEGE